MPKALNSSYYCCFWPNCILYYVLCILYSDPGKYFTCCIYSDCSSNLPTELWQFNYLVLFLIEEGYSIILNSLHCVLVVQDVLINCCTEWILQWNTWSPLLKILHLKWLSQLYISIYIWTQLIRLCCTVTKCERLFSSSIIALTVNPKWLLYVWWDEFHLALYFVQVPSHRRAKWTIYSPNFYPSAEKIGMMFLLYIVNMTPQFWNFYLNLLSVSAKKLKILLLCIQ